MIVSGDKRRSGGSWGLSVWHCDSGSSAYMANSRPGMLNFRNTNIETHYFASGHTVPYERGLLI